MGRKIKVLIVVGSLGVGGNELFVMNILRAINYEKFSIDLLVYDKTRLDFYDEAIGYGCKIFLCRKQSNMAGRMAEVYRCIKKEGPYDAIHVNSCSFKGLLTGTVPAKIARTSNVIAHSHNSGNFSSKWLDRVFRLLLKSILENSINVGLSCSDLAGRSKYTERFMMSKRYNIIHNAIFIDQYRYHESYRKRIRKQYCIEEKVVVGNVGRLVKQKNQRFLIELLPDLINRNKNFLLMIIGDGELEQELKSLVHIKGLENYVLFTGNITNVNEFYSAMDVFVMSSEFEGFPFTAVEAQANGLKCILSDHITQMTNISGDVAYVSLRDKKEWEDKICEAAVSRSEEKKTDYVINQYDLRKEIKVIEEYYQNTYIPENNK